MQLHGQQMPSFGLLQLEQQNMIFSEFSTNPIYASDLSVRDHKI